MMMGTPEIARLLRAIADVIENNDREHVIELITSLKPTQRKGKAQSFKGKEYLVSNEYLAGLAERILGAIDRIEGRDIIKNSSLTRKDLLELGRIHNVHLTKEDKLEVMEDKIVEALVGSRLNSRAIRGDDKK